MIRENILALLGELFLLLSCERTKTLMTENAGCPKPVKSIKLELPWKKLTDLLAAGKTTLIRWPYMARMPYDPHSSTKKNFSGLNTYELILLSKSLETEIISEALRVARWQAGQLVYLIRLFLFFQSLRNYYRYKA